MRSCAILLATASLSSYAYAANPYESEHHEDLYHTLRRRAGVVYDGNIADSYDFVIVGGGPAGLVIASRLSEDPKTSVLVLEAGDTGDAVRERINTPGLAYYNGLLNSEYDWRFMTVPQPQADNREVYWPRGKVLGGSTAVNGMYQIRPSKLEVDAWSKMIEGGDIWSWDNFLKSMRASETFSPPSQQNQEQARIQFKEQSHGTSGPIHASYPGFSFPVYGDWINTLAANGIAPSADPNNGETWGGFIATSAINPANWTRSYAVSGYIDPLPPRSNLAILPNATATKIVFDNAKGLTATGVEYGSGPDAPRRTVKVNKEVILAGGAIGSPHVLMHSGVGPKDVLDAAQVPVVLDLPGVGQHLQDHIGTGVRWTTDIDTAASLHKNGQNSAEFLSFINSAVAYVDLPSLFREGAEGMRGLVADSFDGAVKDLVPSTNPEVIEGYKAIYKATQDTLDSPLAQVEMLMMLTESGEGDERRISIQSALQHSFSQGRLWINSSDPFAPTLIDAGYFTHPADIIILREGLKLARRLAATEPLSKVLKGEISPGAEVQTDEDIEKFLRSGATSEFHPSSSCAMLPRNQGGVVDANLKVYGLENVRVADGAVFPIQFAAHLQAAVYGLGEQAAGIIRAAHNLQGDSGVPAPNDNKDNGGASLGVRQGAVAVALAVAAVFTLL